MKNVLFVLLFCSVGYSASWVDENNVEWSMISIRVNHASAVRKCRELGFQLPGAESFWQAIDLGLMSASKNPVFGAAAKKIDWVWVREPAGTPSFSMIASKWEDFVGEVKTQRHWALCARRASR